MKITSQEARERGYEPEEVRRIEMREQAQLEAERLREKVKEVFKNIPKPSTTLHVARALDDEWNLPVERANELSMEDSEIDWIDVSKAKTEVFQEYFNFADSEGWRFYMPAFMSHYLSEFPNYGYDAVYWACTDKKKLEPFTEKEKDIINQFLELCTKYECELH